jgi:hypothetical protein
VHISFDESYPKTVGEGIIIDGAGVPSEDIIKDQEEKHVEPHPEKAEEEPDQISEKKEEDHSINNNDLPLEWKSSKDHPIDNILGDISKGVTTRSKISNFCYHFAFVSQIEPKTSKGALLNEHWFLEMQEELNQFKRNEM